MQIDLTPEEIELFKKFRQHQDKFVFLLDSGIFDVKGGSIEIHCDHKGNFMQSIEIKTRQMSFKRARVDKPTGNKL